MPQEAYMWMTDENDAVVKGGAPVAGREDSVEVFAFEHEVRIPTDPATGALTGTRKHEAVKLVKAFDPSSPYLYKAVCEGQTFNKIEIKWYRIDESGMQTEYFRHTLEKCKITSVKPIKYNTKDPSKERYFDLEEVQIRYHKITWLFVEGTIETFDSWSENV